MITYVMRFNADPVPAKMGTFSQYGHPRALPRYAEIAESLGIKGEDDADTLELLIAKIEELRDVIGIKRTIGEYGVDEKDFLETLDEMTEHAFDNQCTGSNPRYPLMSEIREMYLKAYYGE
jgi:acetaldehyde dehydrogenase/alcohol dehydrogenase